MKPVPISDARRIGQAVDADGVLIIAVRDDKFCITTYGRDRRRCELLSEWTGGRDVNMIVRDMAEIVE